MGLDQLISLIRFFNERNVLFLILENCVKPLNYTPVLYQPIVPITKLNKQVSLYCKQASKVSVINAGIQFAALHLYLQLEEIER